MRKPFAPFAPRAHTAHFASKKYLKSLFPRGGKAVARPPRMHLLGELRVFLPGHAVLRPPSVWEAVRRTLGLPIDLSTGEQTTEQDALTLVEYTEQAMATAGITNATWFALDEQILFHDRKRNDDDLHVLERITQQEAPRLAGKFCSLTLVCEHQQEDVESLLETKISPQFRSGEPAIHISFGGRISSLRRTRGESYTDAREQLRAALLDRSFVTRRIEAFEALHRKLSQALQEVLGPEARLEESKPRAILIRPSPHYLQALSEISLRGALMWARPHPLVGLGASPVIDPWDRYYQDLTYAWVDLIELDEQVYPEEGKGVAQPLPILDTRGHQLNDGDEAELRQKLYSAHIAAMHNFNNPTREAVELRGYEKADGA